MSGSHQAAPPEMGRKPMESNRFASAVRFVHTLATVLQTAGRSVVHAGAPVGAAAIALGLIAPLGAAGCVVPPDLTTSADAGLTLNSPPIIVNVADRSGNPFTRPGPRLLTIENDRLAVTVSDNDLTDVLTIYFFTDYGFPAPVARRAECLAAPGASEEPQRTVLCDVNTVCLEGEQQTNPHIFEIEVFDRAPVDGAEPLFRSVAAPGLSTSWWWQVNCTEAPS